MSGLKVLITNFMFATPTGSETYVRDLALGLLRRGHTPIIYSPRLGDLAREVRNATIPVVDDLNSISVAPDVIHGQQHNETMTALLHFPGVPAIYVCHDWYSGLDRPPRFPRVMRYIAVDQTCYNKLVFEHAVPEERISLLLNSVDLERFKPRAPLPARPRRALLLSNYPTQPDHLEAVRAACLSAGIDFDVRGASVGMRCAEPEKLFRDYEIVFAKGRTALEALAVGCAVIIHLGRSVGELVTSAELDRLLPLNFGIRAMEFYAEPAALGREVARQLASYDAADAAEVSRRVRALADQESALDDIIALYEETITDWRASGNKADTLAEWHAASDYVRWLASSLEGDFNDLNNSATLRLKRRFVDVPLVGKLSHTIARWLARRVAR